MLLSIKFEVQHALGRMESLHGTIWHSTRRFEPTGQRAGS
jgi:hypothetical protein